MYLTKCGSESLGSSREPKPRTRSQPLLEARKVLADYQPGERSPLLAATGSVKPGNGRRSFRSLGLR
jgi:hypothetical protein